MIEEASPASPAVESLAADIQAMFDFLGDEARPESYARYLLQPGKHIAGMVDRMKVPRARSWLGCGDGIRRDIPGGVVSEQEWLLVIVGLLHLGAGFLLGCWLRQAAVDRMQRRLYGVVAEFSDGYMKGFVAGVKAESDDA